MKTAKWWLAAILVSVGCGASTDPCQSALSYAAACGESLSPDFMSSCAQSPQKADEISALSCEQLSAAVASGKADGALVGLAKGQSCVFNFQCTGDLVCATYVTIVETGKACHERVGEMNPFAPVWWGCDSDTDCKEGLSCGETLGGDGCY